MYNKKINWLEGRVKEIAQAYHDLLGLTNITYNVSNNKVEFYSDGYFVAIHTKYEDD